MNFLFFPVYVLFLLVLVINVQVPKGKKKEWRWVGRGYWPSKSPGNDFSWRGWGFSKWGCAAAVAAYFSVCTSVRGSSNKPPEHRSPIFRGQGPFYTRFHKLCVAAPGTCAWLPVRSLGVGDGWWSVLRAEIHWNKLQFTVQAFPWKVQAFSRFQDSKIVKLDSASTIVI